MYSITRGSSIHQQCSARYSCSHINLRGRIVGFERVVVMVIMKLEENTELRLFTKENKRHEGVGEVTTGRR